MDEVVYFILFHNRINYFNSYLLFVSAKGSDCGLVNVNIPTNGAEIGGAFGLLPFEIYIHLLGKVMNLCSE